MSEDEKHGLPGTDPAFRAGRALLPERRGPNRYGTDARSGYVNGKEELTYEERFHL